MFVRQLKGSALMKYDMEVHKRKEDPDTDRAYATLVHNVEAQIREQRNHRVETQLGQGTHLPPALPAPPGTLCRYFTEGTCRKGDHCDMVHCEVTKRAHKPSANPPPGGTGDKGAGRGGGVAKGGGKGQPQAKPLLVLAVVPLVPRVAMPRASFLAMPTMLGNALIQRASFATER